MKEKIIFYNQIKTFFFIINISPKKYERERMDFLIFDFSLTK